MSIDTIVSKRTQGAQANRTGNVAEGVIGAILNSCKVEYIAQYHIGISIFGHPLKTDFYLPNDQIIIESKWQNVAGSADEKLPYLVMNIRERYPHPTVLVYGGQGWRTGAITWVKAQVDSKLIRVLSVEEFMKWSGKQW